ncbi:MAG: hypothetical protein CSB49_04310 [Proteobacteria bacterium]|nr:MAG: hypothetical protein CSB49_04310 [Pseudomonadota bacterium]
MLPGVDGRQMKLGEILIRHGFTTAPQLEEGLALQVTHGGRVGSNLIDLGYVALDSIARALGQQHQVPAASDEAFQAVGPSALAAVPRDLCAKHGILPLAVEGQLLHLAMRDPQRLALIHQLGSYLGVKVQPYATPELRLLYYLELLYKIPRPKRYLSAKGDHDGGWRGSLEPTIDPPDQASQTARGPRAGGVRRTASGMYALRGGTKLQERKPPDIDEDRPSSSGTHPAIGKAALMRTREVSRRRSPTGPTRPPVASPIAPTRTGPFWVGDIPVAPPARQRVPVLTPRGVPVIGTQPEPSVSPAPASGDSFELVYLDEVERKTDELDVDIDIDIGFDDDAHVETPSEQPGVGHASVSDVVAEIQQARDRESVIGQLLRPVNSAITLNVLLLARGELGVALAAFGTEVSRGQVRQLVVPLNTDSLLQRALNAKSVQRGAADPLQQMIATYLRAPAPKEACVAPIALNNKVINLVCCQSDSALPDDVEVAMTQITEQAAAAYKRLILNKRGSRP